VIEEELVADPLSWWRENQSAKFLWEEESGLHPWLLLNRRKNLSKRIMI
jgi:hypothetical protein